MLQELLQEIAQGGVHSFEDLMRRLSVSQPMLEVMLEELARLGYLRATAAHCDGGCKACSAGECAINGPGKLWVLTEKGSRASPRST